ncbi:hypothetical protein EDD93_0736 [Streptomyces sp. 840.1]|uniref:hypothetical protein n=1 Tax=Streptomyces sp. 840.1 TaxID=2485152 RepID=UPI000F9097DB|nr:hypothetical protein [Streptomyces sp. 840.1]ROQ66332.1 hypothetical protein EDD93_0736 [Streptomyces sp. 840.1]
MREAAAVLGWEAPFDAEDLPRKWVTQLPEPQAPLRDRMRALDPFMEAVRRGPVHEHLLGIAMLRAGHVFGAAAWLLGALGSDPRRRGAWVDAACAYAAVERLDMAMWLLAHVVSGFETVGPNASPYPLDSRRSTEAHNRMIAVRDLRRQRVDELRFLELRTAADEEIRGRTGQEPLGTDRLLLHTAALISLGEAQDALGPFDRAAALLGQDELPLVGTTLEQLARIRIAAGPARERDEVLARLRRTAPHSMVLARLHRPTLLERRLREQEAQYEALLLGTEVERGQQSLREPLEQLRLRARASEHPEPYREALARLGGHGAERGAP